jgi:mRNA interferase RelE/StbE
MAYVVNFAPCAERQFRKLPLNVKKLLKTDIDGLETNPRPSGVKKISGAKNRYRIRVGDFRIIYNIYDNELLVLILQVVNRKDAY